MGANGPQPQQPPRPGPSVAPERGGALARRLGLALGLLAFAVLLAAPQLGLELGLAPAPRRVAAVTALVATLWLSSALPLGATSLLPAVLLPALGVMPAGRAAEVYMSDLVMLFLGAFLVALGVERWGVHRRVALAIVTRVGARPSRLVLGFMLASAGLSMWISNTATTLVMLPIGIATISAIGSSGPSERGGESRFALALLLGTAYASSMGGMATPVGTPTNQVFLGQLHEFYPEAPEIGFGPWLAAWLPLSVALVLSGWWLLTRVVFPLPSPRPEETAAGLEAVRAARRAQGPLRPPERRMALVFAATALAWVTRADLELGFATVPGWSRLLGAAGAHVSDSTVALAAGVLCFALPAGGGRGEHLLDWRTAERLPWDVLLLIGGGFCLARGFAESGLDAVLGGRLAPLLEGRPSWLVAAIVALGVSFLTEVTSNAATTGVLLPVLSGAATAAGLNPLVCMLPATLAASAAYMLPVATPPNAVVFSSRLVPMSTMARAGLLLNLVSVLLITLCFELWARRVLGVGAELPPWAR